MNLSSHVTHAPVGREPITSPSNLLGKVSLPFNPINGLKKNLVNHTKSNTCHMSHIWLNIEGKQPKKKNEAYKVIPFPNRYRKPKSNTPIAPTISTYQT